MKLLLVEDDDVLIRVLTKMLTPHHYIVDVVKDGEMGWSYGSEFEYDLIILDIILPKLDGLSLCQRFRSEGFLTPILLLTSQDSVTAKIQGLEAGADDYVVKPFDQAELIARIRALLRRSQATPIPIVTWGDLLLNLSTYEVSYNGQPLTLSTMEYELLELLLRDSHHVFSTDEIMDRLWSSEQFPSEATVRSHVRRVRQKLVEAGAPKDFIATMHGRGYYLKPPAIADSTLLTRSLSPDHSPLPPAAPEAVSVEPLPHNTLASENNPNSRQQYLAFLNETWQNTKPKLLDQMTNLSQLVLDAQTKTLNQQQQQRAYQMAHKLVGTLGVFGLDQTVQTARQLESLVSTPNQLSLPDRTMLLPLVNDLKQDIEHTTSIQMAPLPHKTAPLLVMISADTDLNQAIEGAAEAFEIQLQTVPLPTPAETTILLESQFTALERQPDVIALRLPGTSQAAVTSSFHNQGRDLSAIWQTLERCYPDVPVVVIGDQGDLQDRIEALRWGGKLFLEAHTHPTQMIEMVLQFLGRLAVPNKVMILDDDQEWLYVVPTMLKPWGFKVTTLADIEQFWTVLNAVTPDALVLDVNMPQVNGFEICRLLRSDPQWYQLPILFLSVLSDASSQRQAFKAGADDYLCKPIMGVELADRILNRLQRRAA